MSLGSHSMQDLHVPRLGRVSQYLPSQLSGKPWSLSSFTAPDLWLGTSLLRHHRPGLLSSQTSSDHMDIIPSPLLARWVDPCHSNLSLGRSSVNFLCHLKFGAQSLSSPFTCQVSWLPQTTHYHPNLPANLLICQPAEPGLWNHNAEITIQKLHILLAELRLLLSTKLCFRIKCPSNWTPSTAQLSHNLTTWRKGTRYKQTSARTSLTPINRHRDKSGCLGPNENTETTWITEIIWLIQKLSPYHNVSLEWKPSRCTKPWFQNSDYNYVQGIKRGYEWKLNEDHETTQS